MEIKSSEIFQKLLVNCNSFGNEIQFDTEKIDHNEYTHSIFIHLFKSIPSFTEIGSSNKQTFYELIEKGIFSELQLLKHHLKISEMLEIDGFILVDIARKIVLKIKPTFADSENLNISGYYAAESTNYFIEKYVNPIYPFMDSPNDRPKGRIFLFTIEYNEFNLNDFQLKSIDVNLETMFDSSVNSFYAKLTEKLEENSGLYLLHGLPGTGKTSFLNHLIQNTAREFIFMPVEFAKNLGRPDFINLLYKHKNSILIIEDAEDVLRKRGTENNSIVSNLLNITDGILGSVLNLHVICTLNNPLDQIDNALLRKGRLKARCYFDKLDTTKANALSEKLGFNTKFNEPVTLADIYNQEEVEFGEIKKEKIGF